MTSTSGLIAGCLPSTVQHGRYDLHLSISQSDGLSFIIVPLAQQLSSTPPLLSPRPDLRGLSGSEWSNGIVGLVTSTAVTSACKSTGVSQVVDDEVDWAMHMGVPAVMFPPPPGSGEGTEGGADNYARLINSVALKVAGSQTSIWMSCNFLPTESCYREISTILSACDYPSTVHLNLVFPSDSENSFPLDAYFVHLNRIIGLGVAGVTLPTSGFLTNKKGYPTLSKKNQAVVEFVMQRGGLKIRWVLAGEQEHFPNDDSMDTGEGGGNKSGYLNYLQYLFHVRNRASVTNVLDNEEAKAERGYLDYLQAPLQPLADNLEFMTYETFEKDPVKYRNYENAVLLAIRDGGNKGKWKGGKVNLMVVGAGRGPLVQCSLNAVRRYNEGGYGQTVVPNMLAVEKNKNAIVFLHSRCQLDSDWKGTVRVVSCDMREAKVDESDMADIVVSELLGSFGDNELSPECLDGAQKSGLMREDAVSIPQDYTSFIAPLSSSKLHQEAKAQAYMSTDPTVGPMGQPFGFLRAMETPYVVRTHSGSQTHGELECFKFVHPRDLEGGGNERFVRVEFRGDRSYGLGYGSGYGAVNEGMVEVAKGHEGKKRAEGGEGIVVHGLTGSFDSLLYKMETEDGEEERISIAPNSFSVGMFSWFPLFFPLRDPVFLPEGGVMGVSIWRVKDERNIWYEWKVEVKDEDGRILSKTPVHNVNGRSYKVGL